MHDILCTTTDMDSAMHDLITASEMADHLGVDRTTVIRRVDAGSLEPVAKLPGKTGAYLFARPTPVDEVTGK
jgi:hypothetical protein